MQTVTNAAQIEKLFHSNDLEVNIAQGNFEALIEDLLYLPEIMSPSEFVLEYSGILSEAAAFIIGAHDALLKVTDPSVLSSQSYKTVLADLTTKTKPSLYAAAMNDDPTVLASLLLAMKGTGAGLTIAKFEGDMNAFDRL